MRLGFYGEMPNELAKLPTMLADTRKLPDGGASMDETHRPAAIMASKQIRTDLAMNGIKLNARLLNENLQNMRKKSLPCISVLVA